MVDGLMLIGGPDIDPIHYDQTAHPGLRQVTPERDNMELTVTQWALHKRLPILAICRGIQVLNVAAGGSLWQDIPSQLGHSRNGTAVEHSVPTPLDAMAHVIGQEANARAKDPIGRADGERDVVEQHLAAREHLPTGAAGS